MKKPTVRTQSRKWIRTRTVPAIILAGLVLQTAPAQYVLVNSGSSLTVGPGAFTRLDNLIVQSGALLTLSSGCELDIVTGLAIPDTIVANSGSTVNFVGGNQTVQGRAAFANLEKSSGGSLSLSSAETVNGILTLQSGTVVLNGNNLTLSPFGSIAGGSTLSFIVTNDTGSLRCTVGASNVQFPIGPSASLYNPVTISNTGTPDVFSARVRAGFDIPPPNTNASVSREWTVSEDVPGGSNAVLSFQWSTADEESSFVRTGPFIERYAGLRWEPTTASVVNLASGDYVATGGSFSVFSKFAVADELTCKAGVKVLLEGPYNSTSLAMNTVLRTGGYLASHFGNVPIPGLAVDSINIEMRNAASASAASTRKFRAAWLLSDGTIRDFADTTASYVTFDTLAGNYYLVISHRNHIPIMTASAQTLSSLVPGAPYDFTTAQAQAFGSNPMKAVAGGRFAMIAGDASGNGQVATSDINAIIRPRLGQSGYQNADINLNGQIQTSDINTYVRPNLGKGSQVPAKPVQYANKMKVTR